MVLKSLLSEHKTTISKAWFESVVAQYPMETSAFLKGQQDPFANPVGTSLKSCLDGLVDELVGGANRENVTSLIDPIVRVRAVQDFTPSQAVGFILSLKPIIRKIVGKHKPALLSDAVMTALEDEIDVLMLLAFEMYVRCRERLFDIKANQEKSKVYKAFKRAGLITEITEEESAVSPSV